MFTLKEIAAEMENCERSAKRWWKKIDAFQSAHGLPRVKPDVIGHGAHKWENETAQRLIQLYKDYYKNRGTTPQLVRAKYAGDLFDARQLTLTQIFNVKPQTITSERNTTSRMGESIAGTKTPLGKTSQRQSIKAGGKAGDGRIATAR